MEIINGLSSDENNMVILDEDNASIIEETLSKDKYYNGENVKIFKGIVGTEEKDEIEIKVKSLEQPDIKRIVQGIAKANHTRTSGNVCGYIAEYITTKNNKFFERLKKNDITLVDEIVLHCKSESKLSDNASGPISLVSKVCTELSIWIYGENTQFTKYDKVVKMIIPYYLGTYNLDMNLFLKLFSKENTYENFHKAITAIKEKVKVLTYHQIDIIIWYAYKKYVN